MPAAGGGAGWGGAVVGEGGAGAGKGASVAGVGVGVDGSGVGVGGSGVDVGGAGVTVGVKGGGVAIGVAAGVTVVRTTPPASFPPDSSPQLRAMPSSATSAAALTPQPDGDADLPSIVAIVAEAATVW